jgi:hypothetical protein
MRTFVERRFVLAITVLSGVILALAALHLLGGPSRAEGQSLYTAPRTQTGQPDLQGVWQSMNAAAWNLEAHAASTGVPASLGVVEGGTIPYLPAALATRNENYKNRRTMDPVGRCFLPGVPRITYMGYPFQIVQFPRYVVINYEYLNTTRVIYTDGTPRPEADVIDFFMGASDGKWEGQTLVVETTNNKPETWFDNAGNFHSEALVVVERFTPVTPNHLTYEVTITDPNVFTRPWKMTMPLYRRMERDAHVLEYECFAYAEEDAEAAQ